MKRAIMAILMLSLCAAFVSALRNPAAAYCTDLGYEYVVESAPEGELGLCKVDSTHTVDAWQFLQGNQGIRYNYCTKEGYATRVVTDPVLCARFMTESCAVCVMDDGKEQEVTDLMGLSFAETACGDGSCGFPEDESSCPKDCEGKMPSVENSVKKTSADFIAESGEAGIADRGSYGKIWLFIVGGVVVLAVLFGIAYKLGRRKSKKK
jgi:putative hemolysin